MAGFLAAALIFVLIFGIGSLVSAKQDKEFEEKCRAVNGVAVKDIKDKRMCLVNGQPVTFK